MSLDHHDDDPPMPPPTRCPSCGSSSINVYGNPNSPTGFDLDCDDCKFDSELARAK